MPALPIEGYDTSREDGVTRIRPVYAAPLPVEAVSVQGQGFPQEPLALPVELPVAQPSSILADADRALSGAVRAPFDALDERLFGKSGKKGTYREAIQKFFKTGPSDEVKTGVNRLLGTGGEERYKTWPEKLVVDAVTAPGNVLKSETPVSTEELIKPALDVSNLAGTGGLAGAGSGAGVALGSGPIAKTWWHGSASGDLRGGTHGLHLGTKEAAKQALEARIGIPADGKGWTGDRSYGQTLLAGQDTLRKMDPKGFNQTGFNARLPKDDFYPSEILKYADGSEMPMHVKPSIQEFELIGKMNNLPHTAYDDFKANGYMKGALKKGNAKNGYYYKNVGEDAGSISIVVPNSNHIKAILRSDNQPSVGIGAVSKSEKPFYSALERSLGSINQNKASGEQWLGMLANKGGVKPDELQWSGIGEFLAGKPSVTKAEIDNFLKDNAFGVQEIVKGGRSKIDQAFALAKEHGWKRWEDIDASTQAKYLQRVSREAGDVPTKYHDYQLPGGENYREVLMTLPDKHADYIKNLDKQFDEVNTELRIMQSRDKTHLPEYRELSQQYNQLYNERKKAYEATGTAYQSSHWDEPNILAHMRMNDRTIDGKKSLHLEEIQSDWHQAGRKQGYKGEGLPKTDPRPELEKATAVLNDIDKNYPYDGSVGYKTYVNSLPAEIKAKHDKAQSDIAKLTPEVESYEKMLRGASDKVPDAPFKKNWHELALKRAIREAAENGYERLSWTPGEAQAARYDLSKQVDQIKYLKNDDGTYNIVPFKNNAPMHAIEREAVSADKLADIVGKEVAEKIIKDQGKREGKDIGVLEGADLKVGGEGMKGFYDNIVPKTIEKLGKQFGVKVQVGKSGKEPIYYIDIPPAMRDKVLAEGFPLFSANVPVIDNDQAR